MHGKKGREFSITLIQAPDRLKIKIQSKNFTYFTLPTFTPALLYKIAHPSPVNKNTLPLSPMNSPDPCRITGCGGAYKARKHRDMHKLRNDGPLAYQLLC
jgi:hypothetical protein